MNISSISTIDFYVSVIDNYGDMGFALNFAFSMHTKYSDLRIRFFSDDEALFWKFTIGRDVAWLEYYPLDSIGGVNEIVPSELICSFFDYRIPKEYLARFPFPKTIVVFSYFLLHEGLDSLHGTRYMLESGYDTVIHFVPSLLSGGGGVIINQEIERKKEIFLKLWKEEGKKEFMTDIILKTEKYSEANSEWKYDIFKKKWVSVFVYKESMDVILESIHFAPKDVMFFFFSSVEALEEGKNIIKMPFLSLEDYGVFQSLCDANIVRGENSLCQGLLSGKPALWNIYKENNGAHAEKIRDYLSFLAKQFPNADWGRYARIIQDFNEWADKVRAFSDFVSRCSEFEEIFGEISEYVKKECDLIQKFEKIL